MWFSGNVQKIDLKGTVSQNSDVGPGLNFMQKNGKIFVIFA